MTPFSPAGLTLESAELRLLEMPLKFDFETSFGVMRRRYVPLLTLRSGGLEGYAEGVMDFLPLYREETVAGAVAFVEGQLLPRLLGQRFATPEALALELAPYRGNRMARAMVEMAFWDLWAKALRLPLWQVLGGVRHKVPVGVSLGIQPGAEQTADLAARHAAEGYRRIKLKIKPGWDEQPVAAVRAALPDTQLTVDANSAYTLADASALQRLDGYGLKYIEQPLAFDDLLDHAALQKNLRTPLCLDESITSARDTRQALSIGAGRVINLKVARVGGHLEARRIHDLTLAFDASLWCGGMVETGIGRAHNIHLSTLENFTLPGDTSSASRYWERDIIQEPLEVERGEMPVPPGPGIGVSLDPQALAGVTRWTREIQAGQTPFIDALPHQPPADEVY
ncbi:o-succinylbenzoate synthase [Deinococcus radiodurans]|jgi:O-succinylbenzoate synthase (EC 4.2.1.-)|uniref:o-succinylbenzoate synthase n=1 Tax=Deinococcus radiodurans (strain ATCC 13939 / DSM 20539 / JCM 16871 / CCUG 27074 / LMG 4051 / NBRC 15346 / NCIMB 9279 / VKM B-1422 / R1) TaxID=243230 RepID=Q9RZP3_DEIRA|nr:o-succinylbenzoate synthase [Deinococcus radiodurans]AAF12532.1 N-acylamino acid racemase [Deinococcus radiodurans R1 = ATCC 13939 = DSM 20539]QEM73267.1 o-succinylbenzoate synthase [Deinococcus radiodurans]QIP30658.1 o-succinylbenzoate synthase [Deinococcus radiodurans]QIP33537.1 o-succinylbenzoate synthase [Deinococcus radiodurans]UDL02206.1 o-succinylbenzoate synthase [Deinococcus radiodurans R1 = ATCC 13939 = DSM 20539]